MKAGTLLLVILFAIVTATAIFAGPATDTDGDGVFDVLDNCRALANKAPQNCDTDDDGYGNMCDGDFDQNNVVNAIDFALRFVPDFKKGTDAPPVDGTDMDCNGVTAAVDYAKFVPQFKAGKPGPSGLFCAGTVPCDL
jgi:hypothetical protein